MSGNHYTVLNGDVLIMWKWNVNTFNNRRRLEKGKENLGVLNGEEGGRSTKVGQSEQSDQLVASTETEEAS